MIWVIYYLFLFFLILIFINLTSNKFIKFFFTPILIGIFGAFWFIEPGSNDLAPIFSILFLETSILDSNGLERLMRPLIGFIFLLEVFSLIYYFFLKKIPKKK